MARTGRPPKSIEQHKADGTFRRDRHASVPLLLGTRDRPPVPKWLDASSKRAYGKIVRDLWDSGVLDSADDGLIIAAACALGDMMSATADIKKWGRIVSGNRGRVKNPALQIRQTAQVEFRQCCTLLGIGPADRARMANMGIRGKTPAQALPGVGAKPTLLKVVNSG